MLRETQTLKWPACFIFNRSQRNALRCVPKPTRSRRSQNAQSFLLNGARNVKWWMLTPSVNGGTSPRRHRGCWSKGKQIHSYEQRKPGLTAFYCKREVLQDLIYTKPLRIAICPYWAMNRKKKKKNNNNKLSEKQPLTETHLFCVLCVTFITTHVYK